MAKTRNWTYDLQGTVIDLDRQETCVFDPTIAREAHARLSYFEEWRVKKENTLRPRIELPKPNDSPRWLVFEEPEGDLRLPLDITARPEWTELSDLIADADKGPDEAYAFVSKLRELLELP